MSSIKKYWSRCKRLAWENLLDPIRSTTQIHRLSVWNFCACFSDIISQGNQWSHHKNVSCFLRLYKAVPTILFPPRIKMVTARELWHSSITNILSLVVPKLSSFTSPAFPSFSVVSSENLGTILPPVAIAISYKKNRESLYFTTKTIMLRLNDLEMALSAKGMLLLVQLKGQESSCYQLTKQKWLVC